MDATEGRHGPAAAPPVAVRSEPAVPLRPLEVLFSGCTHTGPGPYCVLSVDQRALTLWVGEPSTEAAEVFVDGLLVPGAPVAVEQGLRWVVDVPAGATALEVRRRGASPGSEPWTLSIRASNTSRDSFEALRGDARSALNERDIAAIEMIYERALAEGERRLATLLAHSLVFHLIVERRELADARRWLDRVGALLPYDSAMQLYYRGLLAETRGDLGDALVAYRAALHQERALGTGLGSTLRLATLGQALTIMAQTGDRSGAIEAIGEGLQVMRSEPIDDRTRATFIDTAAWALLVSRAEPGAAPSPYDPRTLLDQARALLGDEPEAGAEDEEDTENGEEEGDEATEGEDEWFTVRINLAYDALERGETAAARWWLDTLVGWKLSRTDTLWHRLLLARADRLEGQLEPALVRLDAMVADADRYRDHGLRWAVRVEHARVLEALGRVPQALAEYAEAERLLEQPLSTLGMVDRDRFLAGRDAVARRRVALLLEHDQPEVALCVARLARTQALRSLDRRLRRDADQPTRRALDEYLGTRLRLDKAYDQTFWIASASQAEQRRAQIEREREANAARLDAIVREPGGGTPIAPDCGALATPGPGAVDLHYVRLEHGWVGFSVDERGQVVHRALRDPADALVSGEAARLGALLLEPFEDVLAEVQRVRIMASGSLFAVAFHTLPLGSTGARLQDDRAVVYGLDLPSADRAAGAAGPAIVLEPPSNLPRAHEEARLSAVGLARLGAEVTTVVDDGSGDADSRPLAARVLDLLPRSAWLHYVGHARSDGLGGWDSELVLASDGTTTLGVTDILALPTVPSAVVLSGCRTGVVDPRSRAGGMSLAYAFLLAGAQVVVATTEEIDDDDAVALMRDFYGALEDLKVGSVPAALAEAQRLARARAAGADPSGGANASRLVRAWVP